MSNDTRTTVLKIFFETTTISYSSTSTETPVDEAATELQPITKNDIIAAVVIFLVRYFKNNFYL